MAAAVGSMYEEKLSPVKGGKDPKESGVLKKEEILKNNDPVPTYNNDISSKEKDGDAVLDEIAAKVDALGFNETDPNHMKCMDTVKSQGSVIIYCQNIFRPFKLGATHKGRPTEIGILGPLPRVSGLNNRISLKIMIGVRNSWVF